MLLFLLRTGSEFFPSRVFPYGMENHFNHIRLPPLNMLLFLFGTRSKFFALTVVPYGMENHFYHIRWPPLNVTILISQVGNYANA